jgi:beta-glucosidase
MNAKEILEKLTLEEKALLTAGADMWTTPAIERLGLPAIRVTDGPNGARGSSLLGLGEATAVCIPCGSALGATWNPELIERVGVMLGQETRTKGARVLLAPTVNLHRSPLGGRNFECYSEDPLLSGRLAAAYVRGVQSQGVATTAKHFVANDAEFERNTIDSVVDARSLRELYLVPFELIVKEGGGLGIMTAYNRVNGTYCSEDAQLLNGILRDDWGFEGFVLTDWFSAGSTEESSAAGLDLQMPGPGRFYGPALAEAVRAERVGPDSLDAQVRRMLGVWEKIGALDDDAPGQEQSIDLPEHRILAREVAADSMVLLRNNGILPFAREGLAKLAVIGPNAGSAQIMGGGSAALKPHYSVTPLDALRSKIGDATEIVYERGCWTEKTTPALATPDLLSSEGDGAMSVEFHAGLDWSGDPVLTKTVDTSQLLYFGSPGEGLEPGGFSFRATGRLTPKESGRHIFTLIQAGRSRLLVDGRVVIDGFADPPPPGEAFFSLGSCEAEAGFELVAGESVEIEIQYAAEGAVILQGAKVGLRPPLERDLLGDAVAAAKAADAVVLVVGTNADWESEGHDRGSMDLPGDQDELIRRVCQANPRTVVCVNTGSPTKMDWAEDPAALLQIWFGGQEMAGALADVLFGDAEPGGRLPTSFPERIEHSPSFGNFPGENSEIRYGEGLLMGYRGYTTRHLPVRFPFGFGLSYSSFAMGVPRTSAATFEAGDVLEVEVEVTNTGERCGAEVVQCYVAPESSRLFRPRMELRAFAKVRLEPGESTTVILRLDDRAFAYWDPADAEYESLQARGGAVALVPAGRGHAHRSEPGWYLDAARYSLRIGRSSEEIAHAVSIEVGKEAGPLSP